jgi:hypothetical protein
MSFKKYTNVVRRSGAKSHPVAVVDKKGTFRFNASALRKYELSGYKFVEMFYDEKSKKIGVKFHSEEVEDSLKFSVYHDKNGKFVFCGVTCRDFYNRFEIDFSSTRNYDIEEGKDGMLVVSLSGE